MTRLQRLVSLVAVAGLLAAAACTSRLSSKEPEKPAAEDDAPARRELRDLAERTYDETEGFFESGEATPFEVYKASRRWLEAELALTRPADEKVALQQAHLDRMRDLANFSLWRTSEVEFYVAEAELQLAQLRSDPALIPTVLARKALQGSWEVIAAQEDGAPVKKPDLKTLTIVGRRGEFQFRLGTAKALLTIDPAVTPQQIEIFGLSEAFPFGGHGIYKLEADKLTLCWASSGERPTELATHAGEDTRLYVLKRANQQ